MARGDRSAAAYRHVDISKLPLEAIAEILSDADAGGREFGLRVVEIIHNGPAQTPIYGVYKEDEDRWTEAKKEFSIDEDGDPNLDLTDDAARKAAEDAELARLKEEEELAKIGKGKNK